MVLDALFINDLDYLYVLYYKFKSTKLINSMEKYSYNFTQKN